MELELQQTAQGYIALINGKTFGITAHYRTNALGTFAFVWGGETPLLITDLAAGWKVIRSGKFGFALLAKPFAYYMANKDEPPVGWSKYKNPPPYYAFVGPTQRAVTAQIRTWLAIRMPNLTEREDEIVQSAVAVPDACGNWPDALLVDSKSLGQDEALIEEDDDEE